MSDCGDPEQDAARLREQFEAHFDDGLLKGGDSGELQVDVPKL